ARRRVPLREFARAFADLLRVDLRLPLGSRGALRGDAVARAGCQLQVEQPLHLLRALRRAPGLEAHLDRVAAGRHGVRVARVARAPAVDLRDGGAKLLADTRRIGAFDHRPGTVVVAGGGRGAG